MKPLQRLAGLFERLFGMLVDFFVEHPRAFVVAAFVAFVAGGIVVKHYDLFVDLIAGWFA
jgi:hypothetical protein